MSDQVSDRIDHIYAMNNRSEESGGTGNWMYKWCGGGEGDFKINRAEFVEGPCVTCLACLSLEHLKHADIFVRYWNLFMTGHMRR